MAGLGHQGTGAMNEVTRQEGCLRRAGRSLVSPLNGKISPAAASGMGLTDSSKRTEAAESEDGGAWCMRLSVGGRNHW